MQSDPNQAVLSKPETKAGRLQRAVLDCRHAPHLEAPEETVRATVDFL